MVRKGFILKMVLFLTIALSCDSIAWGQGTVTRPNTPTSSHSNKPSKPSKPSKPRRDTNTSSSNRQTTAQSQKFTIRGLSFSNTDKNTNIINGYGEKLYSKDMRYLCFQAEYDGGSSSETKTISIKVLNPDGSLKTGSTSPAGYTTKTDITFTPGTNNKIFISGWGNETESIYSPGTYRVELYWDGKLQYQSSVRIYNSDLTIKGINFRNSDKDNNVIYSYGTMMYSKNMRYLDFQLEYDGTSTSQTKDVYLKIIKPNGNLMTGSSSPDGYTSVFSNRTFSSGTNNTMFLGGYGNNTSSSYDPGLYKIELYWDGKLQYQSSVRIYSSDINVKGMSFRNSDVDNNVINSFGSTLYSNDMRYLGYQIKYDGAPTRETKTVYVKIINPDGSLNSGSSSPSGYTTKYEKTFETGTDNTMYLGGWGNNTTSTYKPGVYRVELYWDGKLQYQNSVRIYSRGVTITSLNFRNSDLDNNVINSYGSTLYASKMRYLDIQAEYDGGTNSVTKTVYVKIYNPSGVLETNSSSPAGYTWKGERTFETGNNNRIFIFGWGNNTKSIYDPGVYKIELYWDGIRQYQGSVRLNY